MDRPIQKRGAALAAPIICASALLAAAGCVSTTAGTPSAGDDRGALGWGPDLTGGQLADVLLDAAQVNRIMGVSGMSVLRSYDRMPGDDGTYSDPACAGAVFNTVEAGYKGSGYVSAKGTELSDDHTKHYVDQGVVAFSNGEAARKFLSASQDSWRHCVAKHITYKAKNDSPNTWTIRAPVTARGITAAVVDEEGGEGYACAHAIGAKSNVVIDVSACSNAIADQDDQGIQVAASIVNAIAGKFPT
jgi:PknH-like extracellular domain